ncbi:MAG: translation initiation factor IF-3 [Eubacteriales bacterium]
MNDDIKSLGFTPSKVVRVIGPDAEQMGLLSLVNAQNAAYERGLDLVLIAPQADPPVCKIIDYGRFRFERDKKDKEAKKKQQIIEIKEIQLSCHIDTNDFNTKANHARRFLTDGDKVKVIVRFKGRQMSHLEIGRGLLTRFTEACADVGNVDKAPLLEGRSIIMFLAPIKQPSSSDKAASSEKQTESIKPASDKQIETVSIKTDKQSDEKTVL